MPRGLRTSWMNALASIFATAAAAQEEEDETCARKEGMDPETTKEQQVADLCALDVGAPWT